MATANSSRSRKQDDQHFAEKMLAQMMAMPAPISDRDSKIIEARLQDEGAVRRTALALLTKPGKSILAHVTKDRKCAEAVAAVFVRMHDVTEFHQNLTNTLKQADVWLMLALAQRPDMQTLLDAANAELNSPVH